MRKHFDTISSLLLSLNADEQIVVLLSLVAFFTIDDHQNGNSEEAAQILAIQEHFIDLLKRYVHWKMGPEISENAFTRYILKLSDVREVHNLHKVFITSWPLFSKASRLSSVYGPMATISYCVTKSTTRYYTYYVFEDISNCLCVSFQNLE